jgi:hypothetical protein
VHSELRYRERKPGGGVPAGLARKALNTAARQLGGTDDRAHIGEAAGVILAERHGGIPATEDLAAAQLIRENFGVTTTCITALLQKLGTDGTWQASDVTAALKGLLAKGRPNVDGLDAAAVLDGSWGRWRR